QQHLAVRAAESGLHRLVGHEALHHDAAPRLDLEHALVLLVGLLILVLALVLGPGIVEGGLVFDGRDAAAVDGSDRSRRARGARGVETGAEQEDEAADEGRDGDHDEDPPDGLGALVAHAQVTQHAGLPNRSGRSGSWKGNERGILSQARPAPHRTQHALKPRGPCANSPSGSRTTLFREATQCAVKLPDGARKPRPRTPSNSGRPRRSTRSNRRWSRSIASVASSTAT